MAAPHTSVGRSALLPRPSPHAHIHAHTRELAVNLVNLTPHALTILPRAGEAVSLPPSGQVARVTTARAVVETIGGIDVFATTFGEVTDLPAPQVGVVFIVSAIVAGHPSVRGRGDVVSPGELVRGADGQPVGCRGLSRPG